VDVHDEAGGLTTLADEAPTEFTVGALSHAQVTRLARPVEFTDLVFSPPGCRLRLCWSTGPRKGAASQGGGPVAR